MVFENMMHSKDLKNKIKAFIKIAVKHEDDDHTLKSFIAAIFHTYKNRKMIFEDKGEEEKYAEL